MDSNPSIKRITAIRPGSVTGSRDTRQEDPTCGGSVSENDIAYIVMSFLTPALDAAVEVITQIDFPSPRPETISNEGIKLVICLLFMNRIKNSMAESATGVFQLASLGAWDSLTRLIAEAEVVMKQIYSGRPDNGKE